MNQAFASFTCRQLMAYHADELPATCLRHDQFVCFCLELILVPSHQSQHPVIENVMGHLIKMSRVVRKPDFCICENKDADQLRGNREADQRLCFRYIDSTIPLLPKSEISSLYTYSVIAQPGLCGTWLETPKTAFLTTRLKYYQTNLGNK